MAPYMVKFKKTRKIIIFLAYEHRMPKAMKFTSMVEVTPSFGKLKQILY